MYPKHFRPGEITKTYFLTELPLLIHEGWAVGSQCFFKQEKKFRVNEFTQAI
jgi:hypothetical protein